MKVYEVGQIVRVTVAQKTVHAEIISIKKDSVTGSVNYCVWPLGNPIHFGVKRTVFVFADEVEGLV